MVFHKKKVTVKQLQCLTGILNFLTKVVVPGRVFIRRMYSKITLVNNKGVKLKHYHHVAVDKELKADSKILMTFLEHADWKRLCHPFLDWSDKFATSVQLDFYTDASQGEQKGFGCMFGRHFTFGQWEIDYIKRYDPSIEYLELYALCAGIFTWQEYLTHCRIVIFCDNQAVVSMVNNTTSSCKNCMLLLSKLVFKNLTHNRRVFVKYVRSRDNGRSDALSRLDLARYFNL